MPQMFRFSDGNIVRMNFTMGANNTPGNAMNVPDRRSASHGFRVLTILTVSVGVCWLPNLVFFAWSLFEKLEIGLFFEASVALYYTQALLDPFYFVIALDDLRREARRVLRIV